MPRRHRYHSEPFPIKVTPGSQAAQEGVQTGDVLLTINDEPVGDYLEFYQQLADDELALVFLRPGTQTEYAVQIERTFERELGLIPNPAPLKDIVECENKCVFCFIHQQPKGLRRTLFIRDDDYRYSFSHGNFITLTNLLPQDWRRIYREHLSPLNISVHATNPAVREKMVVNHRAGRIKAQLQALVDHDIEFHTQIVLCPGLNDGKELTRTIKDLIRFVPQLLSVSIVPQGLTQYRAHLPQLKPMTGEVAKDIIALVEPWQAYCQQYFKQPLVRMGDEFYWLAGQDYPPREHYGDFAQLEDGVGGARLFTDSLLKQFRKLPSRIERPRRITIFTGQLGGSILTPLIERIHQKVKNLQIDLVVTFSQFWGPTITVAGLLMGQDLIHRAKTVALGDEVWIPEIMIRNDERRFLDDMTAIELEKQLQRPLKAIPERGEALIQAIRDLNTVVLAS